MAEDLIGEVFLAVGCLADGEVATLALVALAADDGEWHNDTIALLKVAVHAGPDFHNLAHHLVAHDVAGQHGRNVVVEEMEVGSADSAACDPHNSVPRLLDLGVRDRIAADVLLPVPNKCFHVYSLLDSWCMGTLKPFARRIADLAEIDGFMSTRNRGPICGAPSLWIVMSRPGFAEGSRRGLNQTASGKSGAVQ